MEHDKTVYDWQDVQRQVVRAKRFYVQLYTIQENGMKEAACTLMIV